MSALKDFIPQLPWYLITFWIMVIITIRVVRAGNSPLLVPVINALNSIQVTFIAIAVLLIGIFFYVYSVKMNANTDAANQVIGAGLGMLTGQALTKTAVPHVETPIPPAAPPNSYNPPKG